MRFKKDFKSTFFGFEVDLMFLKFIIFTELKIIFTNFASRLTLTGK